MANLGDVGLAVPADPIFDGSIAYDAATVVTAAGKNVGHTANLYGSQILSSSWFDSTVSTSTIQVTPLQQPAIAILVSGWGGEIERVGTDLSGNITFYDKKDTYADFWYEVHVIGGDYAEVWHVTMTSRVASIVKLVSVLRTRAIPFSTG